MKKILLTIALAASATMAYGQGLVAFANNTATIVRTNGGGGVPTGTRFNVNLYYNASTDPANAPSSFTIQLGSPIAISPVAGRFNGGNRTTPDSTAPGAPAWFQVKAWETAFGASYEEAVLNAGQRSQDGRTLPYVGVSAPLFLVTGTAGTGGTPLTSNPMFTGVNVNIVPEPSVIALGIIGMTGLLLLRRRRVS